MPPRLCTESSASRGWRRRSGCCGCKRRETSAARPAAASTSTRAVRPLRGEPRGPVDRDVRELRVSHMRVLPDLACFLRAEEVELDGVPRRHRRELDEPLRLAVRQTGSGACNVLESSREQARRPLDAIGFGHAAMFASASDGPSSSDADLSRAWHRTRPPLSHTWAYSFLTFQ